MKRNPHMAPGIILLGIGSFLFLTGAATAGYMFYIAAGCYWAYAVLDP